MGVNILQHADKNINLQVRKEANFYGDMIILPFIDRYDIVVLKTVAICEFGVCYSQPTPLPQKTISRFQECTDSHWLTLSSEYFDELHG